MPGIQVKGGNGIGDSQPPRNRIVAERAHGHDRHVLAEHEQQIGSRRVLGHVAGDELGFRLRQVEGRPVRLRHRRDEEDHEHREQPQPIPAEEADAGVLRAHDVGEVERPGAHQDGDDDEADRDLVGHHLGGRAQRREEGVFRVRGPAADDDAVHAERRDREDVEHADIDVGDDPALGERDHGPGGEGKRRGDERREQEQPLVRARRDHRLLEHELEKIGEGLQQPPRPDDVRTAAHLHRRPDLAVGIERVGDVDQERDEEQQALPDDDQDGEDDVPEAHGLTPPPRAGARGQGLSIRP